MVQAVLPDIGVSFVGDGEGRSTLVCVLDDVQSGLLDRSEVEFRIDVAQPGRCRRDRALEHLLVRSVLHQAQHFGPLRGVVLRIEFENRHLGEARRITDLAVRDHGWPRPVRNHVRPDVPHDGTGSLARRDQRSQHEPAVLRAVASIEQHEVGRV